MSNISHPELRAVRMWAIERVLADERIQDEAHAAALVKAADVLSQYVELDLSDDRPNDLDRARDNAKDVRTVDAGGRTKPASDDKRLPFGLGDAIRNVTHKGRDGIGGFGHNESPAGCVAAPSLEDGGRVGNDPAASLLRIIRIASSILEKIGRNGGAA